MAGLAQVQARYSVMPGPGTRPPSPWYPPILVPTLPIHHPGYTWQQARPGSLCRSAAACTAEARNVHQAHNVEMEILSNGAGRATVSRCNVRPAPDVLTTFQNAKTTRDLIERNTKAIFPI